MLSRTAKVCCRRFPPRISMLMTVTFGRVNLGAIREQPLKARPKARDSDPARHNKILGSRGNMAEMIPTFAIQALTITGILAAATLGDTAGLPHDAAAPPGAAPPGIASSAASAASSSAPVKSAAVACLTSGDGYLRAKMAGAVEAQIDWPNSGTLCEGEYREKPPGVRLSFQRPSGAAPHLLLVFGLTGVKEGLSAREVGTNLTVIVHGTSRIFGTLGDSRCTVDSLTQRPLAGEHTYRIEARGFCTQPAHAVRGKGDVLVSTFEFAGPVIYDAQKN
jgi:hypothetical protein